jgi:hypothetical protein
MSEELLEEPAMPFDPFADTDPAAGLDLEAYAQAASGAVYGAIQNASNSTARSKQQQDMFIGISTLGHCKQYAALMMKQTPFSDERDKTAAFFGTVAGDAIEAQLRIDYPHWRIQEKLEFQIPSGGMIPGTADVIIPWEGSATIEQWKATQEADPETGELAYDGPPLFVQGVWDLKSKAELETIRKNGPTRQQIYQIHSYTSAAIDKGLLNPDAPILLGDVYFDRSGRNVVPYGVFHVYSPNVVKFIDDWITDVKYAVLQGEDAEREMPREWCWSYCEYATVCRGLDTDVEGLITDPELVSAVDLYVEAKALEKEAKEKEKAAKIVLERIPTGSGGSTGTYNIRATEVAPVEMKAFTRAGYRKLYIAPVRKAAPKKKGTRSK